jgi:tRNA nucleotidyltransferase (CCA-adding enzyme)
LIGGYVQGKSVQQLAKEMFESENRRDALEHTLLVLTQSAEMGYDLETRFACLVHDIGKGITPRSELPKHYGHDVKGVALVRDFANRLTVPAKIRDRTMKVTRYHMAGHRLDQMNPKTFVKMFDDMGALNDPEVVSLLYCVCVCDERGRLGSEENSVRHLDKLLNAFDAYRSVKFADVFPNGETNVNKIKEGLFRSRVQAVKVICNSQQRSC